MASLAELLKGKKFKTPFLKEQYIAQQIAALPVEEGGLGLHALNTPEERAAGIAKHVFPYMHGTERLDRFLSKKSIDPKRATSGPMPYGTDAPEIASNYALSKSDTSRMAEDEGSMASYFQVSPKSLGMKGSSPYTVEQSYYYLPPEKRKELLENYYRVGYENPEEATGKFVLHPQGSNSSIASKQHLDYLLHREGKGNPLSALRHLWGESGELYDNPEALSDIYKTAGYPHEILQENAPWYSAAGVFKGNVLADNPLFTSNKEGLQKLIPELEQAFAKDRSKTKNYGVDMWDKNTRYTPKEWVNQLKQDLESGTNSYVWTSIPDKVTAQLKRLGYDAIVDEGGKMGGEGHQVVIPFDPHQVRASTAAFNPLKRNEANLLASHPIANAIGLTGLGKLLSAGQDVDLRGSINDYLSEGYDPAGLEKLTGVAPTVKRGDIAKEALGMTDIYAPMAAAEAYDAAMKGDWKNAGLSALGAMPLVGGMIKASHGSPHAFTKFDFSKIGTGEGAQAYGHGGYFAQGFDSPIAKEYQKRLSENLGATYKFPSGETYQITNPDFAIPFDDVMKDPKKLQNWTKTFENDAPEIIEAANILKRFGIPSEKITAQNPGHLYNVELRWPDAAREAADPLGEHHLLDWDAPLSEQPWIAAKLGFSTKTKDQIHDEYDALVAKHGYYHEMPPEIQAKVEQLQNELNNQVPNLTGEQFYSGNTENDYLHSVLSGKKFSKEQSDYLRDLGIPGIRYLDQGSRVTSGGDLVDVFKGPQGWHSKIKVTNRSGAGFSAPTDSFTTSMPFKTEQEARDWAASKIGAGTRNYVMFDDAFPNIVSRNGVSLSDLLRR